MREYFAEVLARERASLARVTDEAMLSARRRRLVRELMRPQSPYVLALRQTVDVQGRADFLGLWRGLIAEAVDRLPRPNDNTNCRSERSSAQARRGAVDSQKAAVLILAALHGGSTLSQVARDPWPLDAALDLALAPFTAGKPDDLDGEAFE